METIEMHVMPGDEVIRIDRFVAKTSGLSREMVQRLLDQGKVLVNQKKQPKSYRLQLDDRLQIEIPPPHEVEILPEEIPLDVLYEDEYLLVVNKPKGMVVHPASGNPNGTLVNALMHHCADSLSGIGGKLRPGIVHRLDKDTSGLLVVAKDDLTHQKLSKQFAEQSVVREYQAIVYGGVQQQKAVVDAPIGRNPKDRKKMAVAGIHAKRAITHYTMLQRFAGFSHLSLRLQSGRTHQIRVHMASVGHPVAGDVLYGPKKVIKELGGQCLHAFRLGFIHPATAEYIEFSSELPAYFTTFLQQLERNTQI